MEANQNFIQEQSKTFQQKVEEKDENQLKEDEEKVDLNQPHLTNLNEDP